MSPISVSAIALLNCATALRLSSNPQRKDSSVKQSTQRGGALVAVLAVFGILFAIGAVIFGIYVSNANYGNRTEVQIQGIWENNQNILGQYTLKVQEIASVPTMYKDDLKEVMTSVMTARQGPDGSKAVFQMFKEHNINIDTGMYAKIQQVIEAGRNDFQANQTRLIDTKKVYREQLGSIPKGWFLSFAGYPKIKIGYPNINDDDYKPVVAEDTRDIFKKGSQAPIKLR